MKMIIFLSVLIWLVFCAAIGFIANRNGKCGGTWFFISVVVSPLIAGICLAVVCADTEMNTAKDISNVEQHEAEGTCFYCEKRKTNNVVDNKYCCERCL
ncbi:hypothetical protein MK852_23805 [Shewanella benthica]|uniref:hypothetical protein n=1 Tax=Shewanella benthica TaxID=43661 RepID=UPI00187AB45D|nr:hypothetical protein [Shewanella benthica]MBE7216378.1 hypothetical protein [Shewanella benthica]MCL1065120.1 hypothetical protein [Shewanella benthica]